MALDPNKVSLIGVKYELASGRNVTLMWTMNAVCKAESVGFRAGSDMVFSNLRAAVWAALQTAHPEYTLDDIGEIIDNENIFGRQEELYAALIEAQEKATPKKKKADPPTPAVTP